MKIDLRKLNVSCDCAEYFNSKPDFETGWNECPRGEWMIEIASEIGVEKKLIIRTAAECAETVRHLMPVRSSNALDKIIAYCNGEISRKELQVAKLEAIEAYLATKSNTAYAAYSANSVCLSANAYDYDDDVNAYPYTAAYAADALSAKTGVDAANAAVGKHAANTTAYTNTYATTFSAAKKQNQKKIANICRELLTPLVF